MPWLIAFLTSPDALTSKPWYTHDPQPLTHLGASLSNLSQANERGVPLAPVSRVLQPQRQQRAGSRDDGVAAQADGDAVQALLAKLVTGGRGTVGLVGLVVEYRLCDG